MPLPPEIDVLLQRISSNRGTLARIAATAGKSYEMWLSAEIAQALLQHRWTVELRAFDDTPTLYFIQRGSPGKMTPLGATSGPSYFFLRRPDGQEFELHNSLVFKGRSGASHEFDICVVSRAIAESLRTAASPQSAIGHPMLSLECKQYTRAPGIEVSRALIASTFDATRWQHSSATPQWYTRGGRHHWAHLICWEDSKNVHSYCYTE